MPKLLTGATFFLPQQEKRYVLPKFAMGGPDSPSLLELKGRSGLDKGPSPLSVALAITRQSKRNMREEHSSEVLVTGATSPAAQGKELAWQRQPRVPTSSSSCQQQQHEQGKDRNNLDFRSSPLLPHISNSPSPSAPPPQAAWRHLGSRSEAQKYIAPIFTGCPSKDTRLIEIQQTAAAAHAQLISYSKKLKEAVRLRTIMHKQQQQQMRLHQQQQRVMYSLYSQQAHLSANDDL